MPRARVNGVELHYEQVGEGPPLVFSHEFGGGYRSWEPQVSRFARWYRCLTYNHRGFPPSEVPAGAEAYSQEILVEDLRALLGELGIESAHLVGLSLGGNVVLNLALRHPELCRSIVVAGTGSGTVEREQWARDMASNAATLAREGMAPFVERYGRGPTRLQLLRKDPLGFETFRRQFLEHSAEGSRRIIEGVIVPRPTIFALEERLRALRVPTLVVVGDEDRPCVEPALFMKQQIPGAGLAVLPRTGHTINLEEPRLFNELVGDFLRTVELGRWS
ncbi:MAG TPA: alpha/beta hydrolase [Chloroflexota bacterium]